MNGEGFTNLQLNTLLNHFTINYVQLRRDEKKEALNSWKPIVDDILAYVRERSKSDYFATLGILHCGSYYERTKVGEPDEFDLMLVMENAVFYEVNELPGVNKPPTGGLDRIIQIGISKWFWDQPNERSLSCILFSELKNQVHCRHVALHRSPIYNYSNSFYLAVTFAKVVQFRKSNSPEGLLCEGRGCACRLV